MDDAFRMVAARMPRTRRLTPFAARATALLVVIGALVIAFGMGSAYRTALIAGLQTDAVDLVPSVPAMFGAFYSDAHSFVVDPKGRPWFDMFGTNKLAMIDPATMKIIEHTLPPRSLAIKRRHPSARQLCPLRASSRHRSACA